MSPSIFRSRPPFATWDPPPAPPPEARPAPQPAAPAPPTPPPAPEAQPPTAPIAHVDVTGYHGCPFFVTATKVAETLVARGIASAATVRRGGQVHVPHWQSASDRAPFQGYARKHFGPGPHSSPRVEVTMADGKKEVLGATGLVRAFEPLLRDESFGLPPQEPFWDEVMESEAGAASLWGDAYNLRARAFFSADPAGRALRGVVRNGVRYDDIGTSTGAPFAKHSIE